MRILLGIDLRIDGHEWLVHQSVAFAERVSGRIDLVFAAGNEDQAQRQERQRQLEDILQTLPEEVRGTAAILDGEAVEALVAMTDAVDILVVGPREPGALTRWIYGPVAARVVNRARCAVLIPRADIDPTAEMRMLVCVDPRRQSSQPLVDLSGTWAARLRAVLDLAFVDPVRVPYIADAAVRERAAEELKEARRPDMEALDAFLATLPQPVRGTARVVEGEPGNAIIRESGDYTFVAVGTMERSGVARLVVGSVAEQVVRNAHCSVLTLPTVLHLEDLSEE